MGAAFDAITAEVRKEAARHEQLHERLSRVIGPVDDYHEMTSPELAKYALEKMGFEVPADDEHPAVAKLDGFLHGRSGRETGVAGMDSAGGSFIDRYIASA
jgi:hypothetical protein